MKGIGVDIIEVKRIEAIYSENPEAFSNRVLSEDELQTLTKIDDKARFIAKRFAAKEAFAKAVGTGVRAPFLLTGISIDNTELGKPYFRFNESISAQLNQDNFGDVLLSISDTKDYVVAMVVIG